MTVNTNIDAEVTPQGGAEAPDKPEGPISAAIIAAGVGSAALGLFTTLAEISTGFKEFLNFYDPVGPLAGKTTYAIVLWLVSWVGLHLWLRSTAYETKRALTVAAILIGLGVLGTFPTFFEAFAPH